MTSAVSIATSVPVLEAAGKSDALIRRHWMAETRQHNVRDNYWLIERSVMRFCSLQLTPNRVANITRPRQSRFDMCQIARYRGLEVRASARAGLATSDPKFIDKHDASARLAALGEEFALVQNPGYVHPPIEIYPLAPKITGRIPRLAAAVMDMDGTTTTTEALCLHSLEAMVRRMTGRLDATEWPGLDSARDYPHIIGNSTTKHVEYLVRTYGDRADSAAFGRAFLESAVWTLSVGADPQRRVEVSADLRALGWEELIREPAVRGWISNGRLDPLAEATALDDLYAKYAGALRLDGFAHRVRAAIDVYYHRYHEILSAIAAGRGEALSRELMGGRRLIEPMPGVAVFLALVKGWLGTDAGSFYDILAEKANHPFALPGREEGSARLAAIGRRFAESPVRVAVVTSSIRYEAEIVLSEVFSIIRDEVASWPVCGDLAARFESPAAYYDAMLTASDSSEIRLKPHRDLYSIALHALGVRPDDFGAVIGFEDSESGTIAIRAAGIGLCVAVPFADTAGHDLSAAAYILPGGLPQTVLEHGLFLDI